MPHRYLYIFPHPDDESFGPAPVMARQLRDGHEVHLLTLTRGGATRMRHKFGYSVEEMGAVRLREMQCVKEVIGLTGMRVLDLPDSGLKEMDPRDIEEAVAKEIMRVRPDIVITYAVHGISGFHDHLVQHAVVKRAYLELRDNGADFLRRLALFTVSENVQQVEGWVKLNTSKPEEIDCVVEVAEEDLQTMARALECYKTYQEVIRQSGVMDAIGREIPFEIFQEEFDPPLKDLGDGLPGF
ncbi:PIG-L family deacetylase [bacterium]|nr:PIG-L family deacetylase [bacterium]